MGQEALCTARVDGRTSKGKLLLESDVLIFRGDIRLTIRFRDLKTVRASKGVLDVEFTEGRAAFDLGPAADKWAQKLLAPRTRLEKLGVKASSRVAVTGIDDREFLAELTRATPHVNRGTRQNHNDLIFFGASTDEDLAALSDLKSRLKSDGAIWVVRPKGRKEITEAGVMAAGKAVGLVDVKVVKFSETHTAEKFVIPLKGRRG